MFKTDALAYKIIGKPLFFARVLIALLEIIITTFLSKKILPGEKAGK